MSPRTKLLFCFCWALSLGACSSESPSAGGQGRGGTISHGVTASSTLETAGVEASTSGSSSSMTGVTVAGPTTGSTAGGNATTGDAATTNATASSTTNAATGDITAGSGGAANDATTANGNGGFGAVSGMGPGGTTQQPDAGKPPLEQPGEPIFFGTQLDPVTVMSEARARATAQVVPDTPGWRATGDQHRTYHFDATNRDEPYRLYVPTDWDGESDLPLVMFLHGAGSDQNTYVDQDGQLMLNLAQKHGFLLVSPKGAEGAYGNFLRLSAPFGNQAGADELMAQVTPESERANELSETDVINVLELVLEEYPIDLSAIFLTGHSMGSGGTWYIGGKYSVYFRAIAPMSGPFVQETGYPWDNLGDTSMLVTEGTQTPSLEGSLLLAEWLVDNGFDAEYIEVDADHGGMVPLVLPGVFEFFDRARSN